MNLAHCTLVIARFLRDRSFDRAAVLMSTHLLGVAERLCHRIAVMDQGRLKVDVGGGELETLLARGPGALEELYLAQVVTESLRAALAAAPRKVPAQSPQERAFSAAMDRRR